MPQRAADFLPLTHVVYHILLSLSVRARHGYGVIKDVRRRTDGQLVLDAGTLYAAISRLRSDGLLEAQPAPPDADARRRYYGLTTAGRAVLKAESERLAEMVDLARDARILPGAPVAGS